MHFLFPGGIEEKLEENNYDLPKEIDELELNADAIFDQNNIK